MGVLLDEFDDPLLDENDDPLLDGEAFPDERLDLVVEIAWGADLTADPGTWTWTDVSGDLVDDSGFERLFAQEVRVTRGRSDESSRVQPSSFSAVFDNTDGHLTPRNPMSKWWPNVAQGTPIRVSVPDPGGGVDYRFCGQIGSIVPDWEFGEPGDMEPDSVATISASGILRAIGRRTTPLRSALYRYWSSESPAAWWPMEGGSDESLTSPLAGIASLRLNGDLNPGGATFEDAAVETGLQLSHGSTGTWSATIPTFSKHVDFFGNQFWIVQVLVRVPALPTSGTENLLRVDTATEDIIRVQMTSAGFRVVFRGAGGSETTTVISSDGAIGKEIVVYVRLQDPNVGNNEHTGGWVRTDNSAEASATQLALGGGLPTSVSGFGHTSEINWSHLVALGAANVDISSPYTAWKGETGVDRVERLCEEAGIDVTTPGRGVGDDDLSIRMGRQRPDTLINLLEECAVADFGILGEQRESLGLEYRTHQTLYNQIPALTLDASADGITAPLSAVEDDQSLVNEVQATNASTGGTRQATDDDSRAHHGHYDVGVTYSTETDDQLDHQAAWLLHLGTWPEMRYPQLEVDLAIRPDLIPAWLAANLGDRATATGLPASHPAGGIDQLIQQSTETLSPYGWKVKLVGTPAAPWSIAELGDDDLGRADTEGAELVGAVDEDDTALSVATTLGPVWIDTAGHAAEFPFDIDIGGETMTVTAITGTTSPQTLTVTRSVNGVVKSHAAGAAVELAQPLVLAL